MQDRRPGPSTERVAERCVAHPGRPAVDHCPVCERPRCGADSTGRGCLVCGGSSGADGRRPATSLERLVRAALAAYAVVLVAGVVLAEYPGSPFFEYAAPAVGGAAVGAAATAASGEPRGALLQRVRVVAIVYAVLAAAFGFRLDATYEVLDLERAVLVPYLVAGAAAWLWTRPPAPRVRASEGG
ncbi:MAG TPA: hypothetical protein VMZ11_03345 [Mycobacteriales bacterium]|nr:hypothetical protein [Mycobacteriales bacterium]